MPRIPLRFSAPTTALLSSLRDFHLPLRRTMCGYSSLRVSRYHRNRAHPIRSSSRGSSVSKTRRRGAGDARERQQLPLPPAAIPKVRDCENRELWACAERIEGGCQSRYSRCDNLRLSRGYPSGRSVVFVLMSDRSGISRIELIRSTCSHNSRRLAVSSVCLALVEKQGGVARRAGRSKAKSRIRVRWCRKRAGLDSASACDWSRECELDDM